MSHKKKAGHELSDANSKGLMWFGIALFIGAIVMQSSLSAVFFFLRRSYVEHDRPNTIEPSLLSQRRVPPPPRLQINPSADLKAYFDRENHLLSSYGWIDKKSEIARIPIERAMELLASHSKKLYVSPKTTTRGSND